MKMPASGFDTETVRKMMEEATGRPTTLADVANQVRPGKLLDRAQVRPGFFKKSETAKVITAMLRRRMAAQLGRKSPRRLAETHSIKCRTCGGIAVKFEGRWLCEKGHGGNTNE